MWPKLLHLNFVCVCVIFLPYQVTKVYPFFLAVYLIFCEHIVKYFESVKDQGNHSAYWI